MKIVTLITAAALGCGAVGAQAATAPAPTSNQVEPQAVQALTRMSAYLRTLSTFQITLQTQRDDVDVYGQLITLSGAATYKVRRPNAFAINLGLPNLSGQYVYDGKTVTVYDATTGYYSKIQAPSTIRATLDLAEARYGAKVPLDDLFRWAEGDDRAKSLTSAHYIGKAKVAGQSTNHYAFRQAGADWQIWIADGDKPAPLRVAIVAKNDPAKPQFQADLFWDTSPKFASNAFVFAAPPNSRPAPALASNQPTH